MNVKCVKILVLSLLAVFALAFPLFASEEGSQGEAGEGVRVPETVSGIWHEIKEHEEHLNETIKAGKLDDVHKIAFTIRDLSKALSEKSTDIAPDQLTKVKSSVERIAEVAALLDQYGDAGDKANTEDQFTRLGKLLQFIEMQYPEDVLSKAEGSPAHAEGMPMSDQMGNKGMKKMYQCPMDDYVSDKPGKCAKCGMALTEKEMPADAVKMPIEKSKSE